MSSAADWTAVAERGQAALSGLFELQRETWTVVDTALADLCRRRILQLLHAPSELEAATRPPGAAPTGVSAAELVNWPRSAEFGERERAALAFAEQLVVDVGSIAAAHVDRLLDHLSPGECYALVTACWLFEAVARACLVLDIIPARVEVAN